MEETTGSLSTGAVDHRFNNASDLKKKQKNLFEAAVERRYFCKCQKQREELEVKDMGGLYSLTNRLKRHIIRAGKVSTVGPLLEHKPGLRVKDEKDVLRSGEVCIWGQLGTKLQRRA